MSNIPGYLGARQLALQAGAAQGRRNALPLMLQVFGGGHDYRPGDTARVHANRERDEARAFRADELDQNREADYALELLKQEGRAGLQGERLGATADRQTERIDAAQVGREITASTARLNANLKATADKEKAGAKAKTDADKRQSDAVKYAQSPAGRAGQRVMARNQFLGPVAKFMPGLTELADTMMSGIEDPDLPQKRLDELQKEARRREEVDRDDERADDAEVRRGETQEAAEARRKAADAQRVARDQATAARKDAEAKTRGQQFDRRRWDSAMAKARDEASYLDPEKGQRPGRDTPEYQDWLEKRAQEFYDSAPTVPEAPPPSGEGQPPTAPPQTQAPTADARALWAQYEAAQSGMWGSKDFPAAQKARDEAFTAAYWAVTADPALAPLYKAMSDAGWAEMAAANRGAGSPEHVAAKAAYERAKAAFAAAVGNVNGKGGNGGIGGPMDIPMGGAGGGGGADASVAPVLPPEVMAAFGNSPFAAIDAPPAARPEPRGQAFVRDEATGRTVTPENLRDATSIAVGLLREQHPAAAQKTLEDMRRDPQKYATRGIDVQAVIDIYGSGQ